MNYKQEASSAYLPSYCQHYCDSTYHLDYLHTAVQVSSQICLTWIYVRPLFEVVLVHFQMDFGVYYLRDGYKPTSVQPQCSKHTPPWTWQATVPVNVVLKQYLPHCLSLSNTAPSKQSISLGLKDAFPGTITKFILKVSKSTFNERFFTLFNDFAAVIRAQVYRSLRGNYNLMENQTNQKHTVCFMSGQNKETNTIFWCKYTQSNVTVCSQFFFSFF